MKILNNLMLDHYKHIMDILDGADELHIISPFLTEDFEQYFEEFKNKGINKITLITKLRNNDSDLFLKADALDSFTLCCKKANIEYQIREDNSLHGKIYIVSKNGNPLRGIITSANFTERGLKINHEWGVQVDDVAELTNLLRDINGVCSKVISDETIQQIINKIRAHPKFNNHKNNDKIDLDVSEYIYHDSEKTIDNRKYFIKPVGWAEDPFTYDKVVESGIGTQRFSRRRPRAVEIGDILICYGVGTQKLLGYFEVLENPVNNEIPEDRWPWSVAVKNLSPNYSVRWNDFDNSISSIQASFDSNFPLTYVGGKTLGALQYGADKIRLSSEFAQHLISLIDKNNNAQNNSNYENSEIDRELEKAFIHDLKNRCQIAKKECNYNPTRFMQMLAEFGGVGTAKRIIQKGDIPEGFTTLFMVGRLDLTMEAAILEEKYKPLFSQYEIEFCRKRLQDASYER